MRAEQTFLDPLLERIEEEFDINEVTSENIQDYISQDRPVSTLSERQLGLADQIAATAAVSNQIETTEDLKELRKLRSEVKKVLVHRNKLILQLEDKIKSLTKVKIKVKIPSIMVQARELIKSKKKRLLKSDIVKEELWKDKRVMLVVRRKDKKFKTYKMLRRRK